MSRLAKVPIDVVKGVEVTTSGSNISLKGPKGVLSMDYHPELNVTVVEDQIKIELKSNSKFAKSISGTTSALIKNMMLGVTEGFEKKLQLVGVGYRASAQGQKVNLSLGFSHPVVYEAPDGVIVETPSQTEITVKGIDRQKVGQVAAEIRRYRPPEPYKGKGVRYADEQIILKEVKKQ